MDPTNSDDKCAACAKNCDKVCAHCKAVPYCSNECATANFDSHTSSCKFYKRQLELQKVYATCERQFSLQQHRTPVVCQTCFGIKYCSSECMENDSEGHALLCSAFANLTPRPTFDHHLYLLFPADEVTPRFFWHPDPSQDVTREESLTPLIQPEDDLMDPIVSVGDLNDMPNKYYSRGTQYRSASAFHANHDHAPHMINWDSPNKSLGLATVGYPLQCVRGNVLGYACSILDDEKEAADVIPSDLQKILDHFKRKQGNYDMHCVSFFW